MQPMLSVMYLPVPSDLDIRDCAHDEHYCQRDDKSGAVRFEDLAAEICIKKADRYKRDHACNVEVPRPDPLEAGPVTYDIPRHIEQPHRQYGTPGVIMSSLSHSESASFFATIF